MQWDVEPETVLLYPITEEVYSLLYGSDDAILVILTLIDDIESSCWISNHKTEHNSLKLKAILSNKKPSNGSIS